MAVQFLPLSVEYCQTPSVDDLAALPVMAMPTRVPPLSTSENESPNKLTTVSPVGGGVVLLCVILASVAFFVTTGASLAAIMDVVRLRASAEMSVLLPLVDTSILEALA